jgi:hypothetical protein
MMIFADYIKLVIGFDFYRLFNIINQKIKQVITMNILLKKGFYLLVLCIFPFFSSCNYIFQDHTPPEYIVVSQEQTSLIEVYSPSYTDQFQQGEAVTIMWKNTRPINEVNIELLKKDAPILTIQNNEKNQGSYLWQIPVDLRNSLHYQIKVSNSNNDEEFGISERFVVLREQ